MKADRNTIEQAYAFFHQKLKVYEHSTSEREMDHIEDCIADYANSMFTRTHHLPGRPDKGGVFDGELA